METDRAVGLRCVSQKLPKNFDNALNHTVRELQDLGVNLGIYVISDKFLSQSISCSSLLSHVCCKIDIKCSINSPRILTSP